MLGSPIQSSERSTASPHSLHAKAVISENPGNRLVDSQWGHMVLQRSSVSSISRDSPPQYTARDGSDDSTAFVTHDVGLIAANDAVQAPAAIRLAEIGMRKGRLNDIIRVHKAEAASGPGWHIILSQPLVWHVDYLGAHTSPRFGIATAASHGSTGGRTAAACSGVRPSPWPGSGHRTAHVNPTCSSLEPTVVGSIRSQGGSLRPRFLPCRTSPHLHSTRRIQTVACDVNVSGQQGSRYGYSAFKS
jgi:hypothetical protein